MSSSMPTMKALMSVVSVLRPLLVHSRQHITRRQFIHNTLTAYVRENVPATSTSPGTQDILLQNIRSATDSSDVLECVKQHHTIMNNKHVVQALRSIFQLQKSQNSRLSNGEIVNSPEFNMLAASLKSKLRFLELGDQIECLKILSYLRIPATSKIVQILLQLISKQVNDLNLQQITFLDFVMRDFKPTPLVKALKIALPIVFEANLKLKCDYNNVQHLTELLMFASKKAVSESSFNLILSSLLNQRSNIDLKSAKSIVRSLCDTKTTSDHHKLLLHQALDIVTDSIDRCTFHELELLLTKLLNKFLEDFEFFYHEEFVNSCGNFIVDKDCGFEQGIWILKKICRFNHTNLRLLDYMADQLLKEPWQLEQGGANAVITFVNGFSQADYKPQSWEQLKLLVIKCVQQHQDRQELPWLKIALNLCALDCWDFSLMQKLFKEEFLNAHLARDYNRIDKIQLLLLNQVVEILSPWKDKPCAPQSFISEAIEMNGTHVESFPLLPALKKGLGGSEYVLTAVYTKHGHFIDHVVVMRKGGYPVAVNHDGTETPRTSIAERIYVENLEIPNDSQVVAVFLLAPSAYAINSERVRGTARLFINTLEALNISVVPVLQTVWESLPDSEKIPYIMQNIRIKAESNEITSVVTPA